MSNNVDNINAADLNAADQSTTDLNEDGLAVRVTADGSKTFYSAAYQQTFHSDKGALAESLHVFINGSALRFRLKSQAQVRVLEVGFGTGLNFVLSAQEACQHSTPLEYYALEKTLLPRELLERLDYHQWLTASDVWQHVLKWRQHLNVVQAMPRSVHEFDWRNVHLKLLLGDARARILDLDHVARGDVSEAASDYDERACDKRAGDERACDERFDIVYHDAFSFDANSELWSDAFLGHLYNVLTVGGVLVTYSVKGVVRRRLAAVGFQVDKAPGPLGGKREMLIATKVHSH